METTKVRNTLVERLDHSIEVHENRIIVPRRISTTWSKEDGNSETVISFSATVYDDEDPYSGCHKEIEEYRTLQGVLKIAKLEIDLAIAKFQEWTG